MNRFAAAASATILATGLAVPGLASATDNGLYVGAGIGQATVDADIDDGSLGNFSFDGDDVGYKLFAGFNFAILELVTLGVEAGYVSLGDIDDSNGSDTFAVDTSAFDAFGTAGVQLGPVQAFGKLGLVAWDADVSSSGFDDFSEDGTDLAYGLGAGLQFGSLGIRAEYEVFNIDGGQGVDVDDVSLLSASVLWVF
jgi:opacity protein-like surface antigen